MGVTPLTRGVTSVTVARMTPPAGSKHVGVRDRAKLVAELERAGARRAKGLADAESALERIVDLAEDALTAEHPLELAEVARIAEVSRPTLYNRLKARRFFPRQGGRS